MRAGKEYVEHSFHLLSLNVIFLLFSISVVSITVLPGSSAISSSIYFIQLFLYLFFIIITLDFKRLSNIALPRFNFFLFVLFISFVMFLISSFIINFEVNLELKAILKLLTYPVIIYLFFFYLPRIMFNNSIIFEKFLTYFLYFAIVASVISFLMFIFQVNMNQKYAYTTVGIFVHPNSSAFLYTFAIPILIYKYYDRKYTKGVFVILMLLLAFCFIFTLSRGGYLGVFTAVSIVLFRYSKKMFFISLISLVPVLVYVFFNIASTKGDSSYPRLLLALTAYDMIFNRGTTSMLWGYGVYNNINIFVKDKLIFGSIEEVADPHNIFLLLSIQFGILLTISLTVLVLYLLTRAWFIKKEKFQPERNRKISLCLAILIGLLAQNMMEDIIVYPEYYVMSFSLIFLGYLYYSVYPEKVIN